MFGHTSATCFPFAKYLLYREAEQKMDAAARLKLAAAYKAEIRKKQEIRLKRHQLGTIRQMWQAGGSYKELESSLLATMPDFQEAADYLSDNDSCLADE